MNFTRVSVIYGICADIQAALYSNA
jgi:hypothetical protein